ncbi:hypothetical protein E2562_020391 [Oryza meyeriana var. granulata]|uniref:5'-3' DNA helicase ZGRF1-like N-terminal domain-containing protein n=1 Tax=Oryza meyeriana var. granulata TaxID=110450 RepID=A0A6G1DL74_9ORYZ|nr:hypothetical protein E2562_020391 [Oryza meyeriana var. granulata]
MAAEAEPRWWAATYTKHVKQKRKAYQDGALVLHRASGNLVLLDDAGVTVECRVLRAGEKVSPGASLAFQRHLVDVGEPEPHPTCYFGSWSGRSSAAASSASRAVHRGGARARPSAANSRPPHAFPKPTTKGRGGGKDEAADSSFQEWSALYTNHLTQKAKKFHDGVVRLVQVGSHAKQVVLLDEEGEVLGIRYLKSGEYVESGKKCHFPNYLIEICEAKSEKKGVDSNSSDEPMVRTRLSGENTSDKTGSGPMSKSLKFISPQNFHDLDESKSSSTAGSSEPETAKTGAVDAGSSGSNTEWSALYTTQLTQKAKKYHDGVIKLMQVGSHAKQIVLMDEEGGVLGSRYLKSGESIESGMKCQLPNYLIEVCEIRKQKNVVESKHPSEEALSHTGPKNGENIIDKTDDRNKSPKFVSPLKFNYFKKSRLQGSIGCNRPPVAKSIRTNMDDTLKFHDIQKGKPDFTVVYRSTDLGKSTFSSLDDPNKLNVFADNKQGKPECAASYNSQEVGKSSSDRVNGPLGFFDLQDGKSGYSTSFIRREVAKSTFGNTDDSLRTASQILSIMRPPSEIKYPQSVPASQVHTASAGSNIAGDAGHNKTASNMSVINSSNRIVGRNRNSGLSHCATQLRTLVQSSLNLETVQTKNSVSTHHRQNELSRNAHPTYDHQPIMSQATFDILELDMADIPEFDVSNAKGQRQCSPSNHQTGTSNDSAPAMHTTIPGLPRDKCETADQLRANNRVVDEKCGSYPFLSASDLTLMDDDCPSFDLGF